MLHQRHIPYEGFVPVPAGVNALFYELKYVPQYSKWESSGPFPAGAKAVGWISIVCWLGVIGYGRWTAYGMK